MKANELMIGDLITFKDCLKDGVFTSIKVCELHDYNNDIIVSIDGDKIYDELELDEEIVPIPLTPEIIEKNFPLKANCGLKYNPHIGGTCDLENGNTFWIGKWHNGATRDEKERTGADPAEGWWEIVYCEHPYLYEYGMKVRFVHELQHALRLCGIEKEIVL